VLAVHEWADSPAEPPDRDEPDRHGRSGGLILFVVSIGSAAALYLGADVLGWPRNRTLWVGIGAMLAVMTVVRPWWFWENYRARCLRELIGDEPTAGLYLVLAAAMVGVGLFTEWTFGPP
jgi:hypothetical protein